MEQIEKKDAPVSSDFELSSPSWEQSMLDPGEPKEECCSFCVKHEVAL